jgi:hypothetical protein
VTDCAICLKAQNDNKNWIKSNLFLFELRVVIETGISWKSNAKEIHEKVKWKSNKNLKFESK